MRASEHDPHLPAGRGDEARRAGVVLFLLIGLICAIRLAPWSPAPAPLATPIALRIDPNRASAAELELLPEIGPSLAERIIAHRQTSGDVVAFRSLLDLSRVRGLGPKTLAAIEPYLSFPSSE